MCNFVDFHIFAQRASFVTSRKLLASLKLFFEKRYQRSRIAPYAKSKTPKVVKLDMCTQVGENA